LVTEYATRIGRYVSFESKFFDTEDEFLGWLERQSGRTSAYVFLLDSRGKQLSSEELAQTIGQLRDSGVQHLVFAVGPADGWRENTRVRANLLLSFGRITLPHQLAAVILTEQLYRAFTILAGHPYHSGH
jgi:23S rRNA (pseudouridine1915-N3)-methyltransferase